MESVIGTFMNGGSGFGSGFGSGSGSLTYLKSFCGQTVYDIDGVPTLLRHVRGNVAKGSVLNADFTCALCYVVKQEGFLAHGNTLKEAREVVLEKVFADAPIEKRIAAFVEVHDKNRTYPNSDFFSWHNKLTGSCLVGREAFVKNHDIDIQGSMTVSEFIKLTENDYGGDIVRQLKEYYGAG